MVDNGRIIQWTPDVAQCQRIDPHAPHADFIDEIDPKLLEPSSSNWHQFCVLFKRRTKQMWRDSVGYFSSQISVKHSPIQLFVAIPELHETPHIHDSVPWPCCWRCLPRNWQRCIQSPVQLRFLFYCNNSVHVQSVDASTSAVSVLARDFTP